MKIVTTRFAATLLESLHPVSIPVTASVYPYLHTSKRYMLPSLPLCEIEIPCSGVDTGAALHWWARIELVKYITKSGNKYASVMEFYKLHKLNFNDYDYDSATRSNTRNIKKTGGIAVFQPKHVLQSPCPKSPTLAQKLIVANRQIKAYCAQQGYAAHPMFVSVLALKFNTKYTTSQIAHNLGLRNRMVHYHLAKLPNLPFPIPTTVLCVD